MTQPFEQKSEKKTISIPSWILELIKWGFSAAVAIGIVFIRLASLESHQRELDARIVKQEASAALEVGELRNKNSALSDIAGALRERISTLEVRGVLSDKSTGESLVRIEKAIDKLQSDVKEIAQTRR